MKKNLRLIQLNNGKFLKYVEYSQGHFFHEETGEPWEALDLNNGDIFDFVKKFLPDAKIVEGELSFTLK